MNRLLTDLDGEKEEEEEEVSKFGGIVFGGKALVVGRRKGCWEIGRWKIEMKKNRVKLLHG